MGKRCLGDRDRCRGGDRDGDRGRRRGDRDRDRRRGEDDSDAGVVDGEAE